MQTLHEDMEQLELGSLFDMPQTGHGASYLRTLLRWVGGWLFIEC